MQQAGPVVVHQSYVAPHELQLKLKEKIFSLSGDSFEIKEATTKQTWFKVKGNAFSLRDTKTFMDANGNEIATMKQPILHILKSMKVSGNGFSFDVRRPQRILSSLYSLLFVCVWRCVCGLCVSDHDSSTGWPKIRVFWLAEHT
jgi:hypothetical protein